ncbi:MAG TPA: nucleotidyltransferase [Streptosporangiaceae bacterium]|nr:nucleotidyltransferase [Streptosporangiaceae bacterium]
MSLSDEEITNWSSRGDALRAWYSYQMVRDTLAGARLDDLDYGIYPQGSYANKTNIVGDSDVDLVIALRSSFYPNKEKLSPAEIEEYAKYYEESDLTWQRFREAVIRVLRKNYWVHEHSKCVKVSSSLVRLPADVLIALDYRYYTSFPSFFTQEFTGGVQFYTSAGTEIVNYPKRHIRSCAEKNVRTGGRYRPVVRVAKNARNALATGDGSPAEAGTVPSYFLESLLWNVPKGCYEGKTGDSYRHVVGWLYENHGRLEGMLFPNRMGKLFGDAADAVWDKDSALAFIEALYHQLNS